jgi:hypothetical protein
MPELAKGCNEAEQCLCRGKTLIIVWEPMRQGICRRLCQQQEQLKDCDLLIRSDCINSATPASLCWKQSLSFLVLKPWLQFPFFSLASLVYSLTFLPGKVFCDATRSNPEEVVQWKFPHKY